MNLDFWQGKKVFLTGHTGFKGSWLSLWLANLGAEVMGFTLSPKYPAIRIRQPPINIMNFGEQ